MLRRSRSPGRRTCTGCMAALAMHSSTCWSCRPRAHPKQVRGFCAAIHTLRRNEQMPSLDELRSHVFAQLATMREDHVRLDDPTPYKVSVSSMLYDYVHQLWMSEAPIAELR